MKKLYCQLFKSLPGKQKFSAVLRLLWEEREGEYIFVEEDMQRKM